MQKFNELNYCTIEDEKNNLEAKGKEIELATQETLSKMEKRLSDELDAHK